MVVEYAYQLAFRQGEKLAWEAVGSQAFYGNMIPDDQAVSIGRDNWLWNASAYLSWSFRKILTMFTEIKLDGYYCTISPIVNQAAQTAGGVRIYTWWDRSWTAGTDSNYYNRPQAIKDLANNTGGVSRIFINDKGAVALRTKCLPRNAMEKMTFSDSETRFYSATSSGTTWNYYNITNKAQLSHPGNAAFTPVLWWAAETVQPTNANFTMVFTTKHVFYITLRSPGTTSNINDIKLLLCPNGDLVPWNTMAKAGSDHPNPYPITEKEMLDGLRLTQHARLDPDESLYIPAKKMTNMDIEVLDDEEDAQK